MGTREISLFYLRQTVQVHYPHRPQRFVLRALYDDVKVTYIKGTEVPIADALLRISPQPAPDNDELPQCDIHYVTRALRAQTKLLQIRVETTNDPTLNKLRDKMYWGWPDKREKCPEALPDYWNFHEELTIEDVLILNPSKGDLKHRPPRTPGPREMPAKS